VLSKFVLLLQRLNGWRLWAVLTGGIVLVVELIVSAMSLILKGGLAWDYLLTGFVAAILAAPPSLVLLSYLLGELATRQRESLSKNLHSVESRLEMALNAAEMICWELDVVDGSLQYDPSTLRLLGMSVDSSPRDLPGWLACVHPEDQPEFVASYAAAIQTGAAGFDSEYRVKLASGDWGWVHTHGAVVERESDGRARLALGVTMNIGKRKKDETELARHRDHLEALVGERTAALQAAHNSLLDIQFAMNSVGIGIRWADAESGRLIDVNNFAAEMLGYSVEEMRTLRVTDIDAGISDETFGQLVAQLRQQGHLRMESTNRTRRGALIPVELTLHYIPAVDAQPARVIAFVVDITQRKEAEAAVVAAKEAAEAANVAKSAFLANMSHEIRTPLNAITGMSHIIRRVGLPPDQLRRLEKIDAAGEHLLEVINAILDLSKIEAGKLTLQESAVSPGGIVANVVAMLFERATAKGLRLIAETQGLHAPLLGDATRLQQALLNYAGNAIKFSDSGTIFIRVMADSETEDSLLVRFEVQDNGIGIAPDVLGRLFKVFEQADNSISRKYGGTGLGLAITRKLAQLMGGDAGVSSALGVGSTFWFTARLKKGRSDDSEPVMVQGGAAEEILRRDYPGRRILLVEDEPVNREIARELLTAIGLNVELAEDGSEAVQQAVDHQYDLILMDMQMPKIDGLEATRRIRAIPAYIGVPIIAMTANAYDEDRRACFAAGMNDFIAKPINPPRLFEAVAKGLAGPSA